MGYYRELGSGHVWVDDDKPVSHFGSPVPIEEQIEPKKKKKKKKPPVPTFDSKIVDMVNHPPHYTSDPSGVECIEVTRHRNFNIGNAIKYLWRAGLKVVGNDQPLDKQIEDLRKAIFYIEDEIARLDKDRPIV